MRCLYLNLVTVSFSRNRKKGPGLLSNFNAKNPVTSWNSREIISPNPVHNKGTDYFTILFSWFPVQNFQNLQRPIRKDIDLTLFNNCSTSIAKNSRKCSPMSVISKFSKFPVPVFSKFPVVDLHNQPLSPH